MAERVYETLNYFLSDYYTGWTPDSYRRTEAFLRSAVKVDAHPDKGGFYKKDAVKMTELFWETLMDCLEEGREVNFYGIGKFKMKTAKEREARNPQTGETCIVPEHRKVKFYPSETLTEKIENE